MKRGPAQPCVRGAEHDGGSDSPSGWMALVQEIKHGVEGGEHQGWNRQRAEGQAQLVTDVSEQPGEKCRRTSALGRRLANRAGVWRGRASKLLAASLQ